MEILFVILWLIFGGVSSYCAKDRGRDPFTWFFIGVLLGIFGLLLLFLLPSLATNQAVNEENNEAAPFVEEKRETPYRLKTWFYLNVSHDQIGPLSFPQLKNAGKAGRIDATTLVWCEEMPEWKSLAELPELRDAVLYL